jgi:hypothetical protein
MESPLPRDPSRLKSPDAKPAAGWEASISKVDSDDWGKMGRLQVTAATAATSDSDEESPVKARAAAPDTELELLKLRQQVRPAAV